MIYRRRRLEVARGVTARRKPLRHTAQRGPHWITARAVLLGTSCSIPSITAHRCLITVGPAAMPAVPRRVFPQVVHLAGILPVLVFCSVLSSDLELPACD